MPFVVRVEGGHGTAANSGDPMDTLTNNPAAALQVAHETVADRVAEAQARAQVRALRAHQRAARRARHASWPRASAPLDEAVPWVVRPAR
jgi:hypothetical protein